jgi:hypothetical protein
MFSVKKYFDKLISGSFKKQAVILFGLILATLGVLFYMARLISMFYPKLGWFTENGVEYRDLCWWVFLHFSYPGHLILDSEPDYLKRIVGIIITIIGIFLLEGVLISVIVHGLITKVNNKKRGISRYKFSNHNVIIGWDTFTISLLQNIFKENVDIKSKPEILILSSKNTEELQNKIKSNLTSDQLKHVYVYYGELKKEEFEKLFLDQAKEIYILGDGNCNGINNKNIENVFIISKLLTKRPNNNINCYINLPDFGSLNLLSNFPFPDSLTDKLNIKLFNLHKGWARMLWESIDLNINLIKNGNDIDRVKIFHYPFPQLVNALDANSFLHLVIIGFNDMGSALLEQTLHIAHFNTNKPTLISIIDKNFNGKDSIFKAGFPFYTNIEDCRVSFIEKDIYSVEFRDQLVDWNKDKDCRLVISVCETNPDISFTIAGLLPQEIFDNKVPVLVYQIEGEGYSLLVENLDYTGQNRWINLKFYGWVDEHSDLITTRERLAEGIHKEYLKLAQKDGYYDKTKPNFYPWERLPDVYKWSNRYQADSFIIKLSRIGKKIVQSNLPNDLVKLEKQEIELLARMEHDRWSAERIMNGWQFGSIRNNDKKIHQDLVPFDELKEETKNYDYNAIAKIPYLLREYSKLDITPI